MPAAIHPAVLAELERMAEAKRTRISGAYFPNIYRAATELPYGYRQAGREWYPNILRDLEPYADDVSLERLVYAAACLTPGMRWAATLATLRVLLWSHRRGEAEPPERGLEMAYGRRDTERAWLIIAGEPDPAGIARGAKVAAFAAALGGDPDAVPVDRHIARVATGDPEVDQLTPHQTERVAVARFAKGDTRSALGRMAQAEREAVNIEAQARVLALESVDQLIDRWLDSAKPDRVKLMRIVAEVAVVLDAARDAAHEAGGEALGLSAQVPEADRSEEGCPSCGQDIDRLGGNPACATCAAEPARTVWDDLPLREQFMLADSGVIPAGPSDPGSGRWDWTDGSGSPVWVPVVSAGLACTECGAFAWHTARCSASAIVAGCPDGGRRCAPRAEVPWHSPDCPNALRPIEPTTAEERIADPEAAADRDAGIAARAARITDASLVAATDRAIAEENRRFLADPAAIAEAQAEGDLYRRRLEGDPSAQPIPVPAELLRAALATPPAPLEPSLAEVLADLDSRRMPTFDQLAATPADPSEGIDDHAFEPNDPQDLESNCMIEASQGMTALAMDHRRSSATWSSGWVQLGDEPAWGAGADPGVEESRIEAAKRGSSWLAIMAENGDLPADLADADPARPVIGDRLDPGDAERWIGERLGQPCPDCNGSGYVTATATQAECCGNVLPTGECCAAQYGEARLVPVQVERVDPCPRECSAPDPEPVAAQAADYSDLPF